MALGCNGVKKPRSPLFDSGSGEFFALVRMICDGVNLIIIYFPNNKVSNPRIFVGITELRMFLKYGFFEDTFFKAMQILLGDRQKLGRDHVLP